MPKYYSPDDQTLIVSSGPTEKGKFCFFSVEAGQRWTLFVLIVSLLVSTILIGSVMELLTYWKVGELRKYEGKVISIFFFILWLVLMQFGEILYRIDVSIKRDGSIARSIRVLGFSLNTVTFEKGHYRLLVEERHEETYVDTGKAILDARRMSMVDEAGRQFILFVEPKDDKSEKYEGIDEFKKNFFDFTGFMPTIWDETRILDSNKTSKKQGVRGEIGNNKSAFRSPPSMTGIIAGKVRE